MYSSADGGGASLSYVARSSARSVSREAASSPSKASSKTRSCGKGSSSAPMSISLRPSPVDIPWKGAWRSGAIPNAPSIRPTGPLVAAASSSASSGLSVGVSYRSGSVPSRVRRGRKPTKPSPVCPGFSGSSG